MADSEKLTNTINEAGLSKIKQAISAPESSFAVICASRNDLSDEENTERFKALVQDLGTYGYIKLRGGYIEKTATGEEIPVVEKSVLVKYLPYEHAIELGKKYGQESILWKDKDGMRYVYMDGRKPKWFSTGERDLNVGTFEQIGKYFSQRLGDKDRYFAFQPKNETVSNREPYLAVSYYFNLSSKFAHDHCHESEKSYIRVV